jgi:hypothetical protein
MAKLEESPKEKAWRRALGLAFDTRLLFELERTANFALGDTLFRPPLTWEEAKAQLDPEDLEDLEGEGFVPRRVWALAAKTSEAKEAARRMLAPGGGTEPFFFIGSRRTPDVYLFEDTGFFFMPGSGGDADVLVYGFVRVDLDTFVAAVLRAFAAASADTVLDPRSHPRLAEYLDAWTYTRGGDWS